MANWALIGPELEASRYLETRDIEQVLAGRRDYDSLTPLAQAAVRAEWAEQIHRRVETIDLACAFADERRPFVEVGVDGAVVERRGTPSG
ncbi:hypothetical protein [Williamsia deligens]|uniref:Uncharacterized protein n=1 Tax=Williamsia deligens TaxID=321325 RepID=A0ABW3G8A1_9NOCA|nr:hypothetical protein [Williamsia deligens]